HYGGGPGLYQAIGLGIEVPGLVVSFGRWRKIVVAQATAEGQPRSHSPGVLREAFPCERTEASGVGRGLAQCVVKRRRAKCFACENGTHAVAGELTDIAGCHQTATEAAGGDIVLEAAEAAAEFEVVPPPGVADGLPAQPGS